MPANTSEPTRLDGQECRRLLNFIQEPVLIVARSGRIELANAAALALLGEPLLGRTLAEITTADAGGLAEYLKRCSASGSPVVWSFHLRKAGGGEARYQVKGARLSSECSPHPERIVLRCSGTAFREFSHMSRQIQELNRENHRHRHARAVLEESLAQRDVLLREVQHRVRNYTQMLLGMVGSARRGAQDEELRGFLDELRRRLTALGAAQQLMYTSARLDAVPARELVEKLCHSIQEAWPQGAELETECADVDLNTEVAAPLALIINELLSNALKHGLRYGAGRVNVRLVEDGADLVLTVRDNGPGTSLDGAGASSGMALVRGLCRQIGGTFDLSGTNGACCTVRFPQPPET